MVFMMARSTSADTHLPRAREFRKMTGKDFLYNDFRSYLKEQEVGFPADLASGVGEDFLSNLTSIIFPLSSKV